ncbi:hypothetical protein XENOCAPTIV_009860, partial [Xenoophorus captivus]
QRVLWVNTHLQPLSSAPTLDKVVCTPTTASPLTTTTSSLQMTPMWLGSSLGYLWGQGGAADSVIHREQLDAHHLQYQGHNSGL